MSYFCFGSVDLTGWSSANINSFSWDMVRIGIEARLHVIVHCNILQSPARKTLNDHNLFDDDHMSFMLTASPLENTSCTLISPGDMSDEDLGELRDYLGRIADWISRLSVGENLGGIDFFTSLGYDIAEGFAESETSLDDFAAHVFELIKDDMDVPSLRVRITMP